jgi:hypothetical protein
MNPAVFNVDFHWRTPLYSKIATSSTFRMKFRIVLEITLSLSRGLDG